MGNSVGLLLLVSAAYQTMNLHLRHIAIIAPSWAGDLDLLLATFMPIYSPSGPLLNGV